MGRYLDAKMFPYHFSKQQGSFCNYRRLLAGLLPTVMPKRKSHHPSVTDLHAGEFRNEVYAKEAVYHSNTVCYASYHNIAQIIKKVVLKLIHWCYHMYLWLQWVKQVFHSPFTERKKKSKSKIHPTFFQLFNADCLQFQGSPKVNSNSGNNLFQAKHTSYPEVNH